MTSVYAFAVERRLVGVYKFRISLQVNTLKTGSQVLGLKSATGPTVIFPKYNNYLMDKSKFDVNSQIMIPIELLGIRTVKQGNLL